MQFLKHIQGLDWLLRLLQANQTYPTDMTQKSMLFQSCMVKYKYAFNAHNCDKDKQVHMLSEICYVKY